MATAAREPRRPGPAHRSARQGEVRLPAGDRGGPGDAATGPTRRHRRRRPPGPDRAACRAGRPGTVRARRHHRRPSMNTLLWVVYPYVAVAILVGGLIWR